MVRYLRGADREDASCDQGEGIRDYNTINVSGFLICGGRGRAAVIQSKNITESTGTVDFFHGVWSWGTIRIPGFKGCFIEVTSNNGDMSRCLFDFYECMDIMRSLLTWTNKPRRSGFAPLELQRIELLPGRSQWASGSNILTTDPIETDNGEKGATL
jgi:hypothetical protein